MTFGVPRRANNPAVAPSLCPRCGYDQSGIVESWTGHCALRGTCSECGLDFRWVEVLRPDAFRIPWFFEHARGRLAGRWLGTAIRSLAPWWFWRTLALHHAIFGVRLLGFIATLVVAGYLLLCIASGTVNFLLASRGDQWVPSFAVAGSELESGMWAALLAPAFLSAIGAEEVFGLFFPVLWSALMALAYLLLGESLGKARVRRAHLGRGLAYTLPAAAVPTLLMLAAWLSSAAWWFEFGTGILVLASVAAGLAWLAWLPTAWYCITRWYLRLRHAPAVTILLFIASGLAVVALYFYTSYLAYFIAWRLM